MYGNTNCYFDHALLGGGAVTPDELIASFWEDNEHD